GKVTRFQGGSTVRNLFIIFVLILIPYSLLAQEAERSDLGLEGCPLAEDGIAISPDGSFVVAGCDAPKGLYYSFDFGTTWHFASGGAYESGTNRGVFIVDGAVYARIGNANALLRAELPSSGPTWSPDWEDRSATIGQPIHAAAATDKFLVVAD